MVNRQDRFREKAPPSLPMGVLPPRSAPISTLAIEPGDLALLDVAGQAKAAAAVIHPEQLVEGAGGVDVVAGRAFHLIRTGAAEA